ncbi:MAG: hypothetical protein ACO3CQ_00935 [Candidatus Nanopelagicaceae bacterium]
MTAFPYNSSAQGGFQYLLDTFKFPVYGEVDFYCTEIWGEEQLWNVPAGITSISAVLIGGGGSGGLGNNQREQDGGGGGGLRYINGMPVTPGEQLRICVGLGGTAWTRAYLTANSLQEKGPGPGGTTYISSLNNSLVSGRTGIGGTIIVFAGAGSTQSVTFTSTFGNELRTTAGGGGGGTTPGSYAWGTIGGGNGGYGGPQSNKGGGATDGGGGGAAGWITGNTGGNGGFFAEASQAANDPPTNGQAGGGGGGMYTAGGGGNGAGGGGGTGVIWGQGPNGNGAQNGVPLTTAEFISWGGQGGSYGPDGLATGTETFGTTEFTLAMGLSVPPAVAWNYRNKSRGNGVRGFYNSVGDNDDGSLTGVFPPRMGSGGYYGGGGGGADITGQGTPQSGSGACGVVRIIYAARTGVTRNYPNRTGTNILSNWGFPTNPAALGGASPYDSPNLVGSTLPFAADTSRTY